MGNYQGYQKYQDSGVEWLGDIPEHWKVKRLKNIASCNDEALGENTAPDYEIEYVDISSVDLVSGIRHYENMTFEKAPSRARRKVQNGDTIISTVRTYLKSIAAIKEPPINLIVSTGFAVIRPKININSNYIGYLLQSEGFVGKVVSNSVGVSYPAINSSVLISLPVVEPPLIEQEKIAQFLDYKTKQIDELIKKKETLIEKLDEKRTAIISHAVTKGLDSSVPIKDSGIEWLGDIPKHWEVIKVKHLTKILRGKFTHRPRNDPRFYDGQHPFIQTGDVANANKFIMEYTQTLNENGYAVSKEFPSGTLVMTIAANIGDMAILNFNACFPDSIVGFLPSKMTDIFFLYHLFSSMKKQFLSTAVLNTQLNLNVERISNIFTVIPPLKEQLQITDFLNKEMQKLDQQKAKIKEAIELLKEYRTSLITNAVTGKIDVSQIAIPSPQKPQPQKG
jgi:type I restriction enzyme, S subunit